MKKIFDRPSKKRERVSPDDVGSLVAADAIRQAAAKAKSKAMTPEEQVRRKKKTDSVRRLAQQIHKLRRKVNTDLKSDDEKIRMTALAVALMDKTTERVGNDGSAKDGHFGVTGWQNQHVTVNGNTVRIQYVGKSGVDHDKEFTDTSLAKAVKECKGRCKAKKDVILRTSDGFQIHADKVNRYLREFEVTAKDIRGYGANTMVVDMLKRSKTPSTPEERKKQFKEVLKKVAAQVGHQQATLKMHYLLPGVEESYVKSGNVKSVKNAALRQRMAAIEENVVENPEMVEALKTHVAEVLPVLMRACESEMGLYPELPHIRFQVNDWDLPTGKVGSYNYPDENDPDGILTVSPRAFETDKYQHVAAHEMVHAVLGEKEGHAEKFDILSSILEIPVEYRD